MMLATITSTPSRPEHFEHCCALAAPWCLRRPRCTTHPTIWSGPPSHLHRARRTPFVLKRAPALECARHSLRLSARRVPPVAPPVSSSDACTLRVARPPVSSPHRGVCAARAVQHTRRYGPAHHLANYKKLGGRRSQKKYDSLVT